MKTKRLFLALADGHRHAWVAHLNLPFVDLESDKRVLVRGGKRITKDPITLLADLKEQLG